MYASACLLVFGSVCRTFRKAHGRSSSQKLMPRRGTSNSSPGRSISFTDRGSASGSTRRKHTLSQLTPQRAGHLLSPSITAIELWRSALQLVPTMDHPHSAADKTQANAYCQRLVGSIRSERVDFMIPLGETLWFPKTPFSGLQPDVTHCYILIARLASQMPACHFRLRRKFPERRG